MNQKRDIEKAIKKMPLFDYKNIKGNSFKNNNLKTSTATAFFYYNSECDFCNHEAQQVKEKIELFKNIQLVFISFEEPNKIKNFAKQHKLENYDNVIFVSDTKFTFDTTFDIKSLPAVIVYDKQNNLVKKFKGQTKPENIIKSLRE